METLESTEYDYASFMVGSELIEKPRECRVSVDLVPRVEPYHSQDRFNAGWLEYPPSIRVTIICQASHEFTRVLNMLMVTHTTFGYSQDNIDITDICITANTSILIDDVPYIMYSGPALRYLENGRICTENHLPTVEQIKKDIRDGKKSVHVKRKDGFDILL